MATAIVGSVGSNSRVSATKSSKPTIKPSIASESSSDPFTLDQELSPFGTWTRDPIWVPPKNSSKELARSMLNEFGLLASKEECWNALVDEHRSKFTQVREIELDKASIRLPKGRLFVSITEQSQFDQITDTIPNCVRTRLEEFLAGPGKKRGVKVYYLKPLCVEVNDDLIFTTSDELNQAIWKIQHEVFSYYRRMYALDRTSKAAIRLADLGLSIPRKAWKLFGERKKRAIEAYHAKLEFNRRKTALKAASLHRQYRTDDCTFNDILSLTNTPDRVDVIEQYAIEHQLSRAQRDRLLKTAAITAVVSMPWFVSLSLALYYVSTITITIAPPIIMCDPAFVAEMPDAKGVLLKIGHFDEVRGITHVEI